MPTTSPDALPYPDGSGQPYVHLDIKALADAVQAMAGHMEIRDVQVGSTPAHSNAAGATTNTAVTFPVAYAAGTNVIVIIIEPGSTRHNVTPTLITATGYTHQASNWTTGGTAGVVARYIAFALLP